MSSYYELYFDKTRENHQLIRRPFEKMRSSNYCQEFPLCRRVIPPPRPFENFANFLVFFRSLFPVDRFTRNRFLFMHKRARQGKIKEFHVILPAYYNEIENDIFNSLSPEPTFGATARFYVRQYPRPIMFRLAARKKRGYKKKLSRISFSPLPLSFTRRSVDRAISFSQRGFNNNYCFRKKRELEREISLVDFALL